MEATVVNFNLENAGIQFNQANAQTRLVVLHYLAKQLHKASKTAKPGAFFSQKVQGMLKQVQQVPREERQEALQEILTGTPTRLTEVYEGLDTNMRMAFWYRLANGRKGDSLLSKTLASEVNSEQAELLSELASRDSNELVSFLRKAVAEKELAVR
ncbi:MAG: orange carotenoid protein N-terminal domain-containing protein [Cyanobacteria bacterium P01_F01_bin.86]